MLTVVAATTGLVEIAKEPVVPPAAIVAEAGTVAAAPELTRVTAAPPAGAGLEIVTVPVTALPPVAAAVESAIDKDALAGGGVEPNRAVAVAVPVPPMPVAATVIEFPST